MSELVDFFNQAMSAAARGVPLEETMRRVALQTRCRHTHGDLECSTFQDRPAYRYIRRSDHLPTYEQLGERPLGQIQVMVRLFDPQGAGTWWIAAYDPQTRIAWGVAYLFEREVGDFSMEELVDYRGRLRLPIERDLYFRPGRLTLRDVLEGDDR